ncbi:hypothetical protein H2200_002752 [Cladophialophora chaetospira]|uniref:Uncharacterized protein n=1 Tax=Cladophialophora chaetospira TaxID=386627 RepID=A0AA39CNV3_9EURO|nr:hypothetical protein H2200_002752 [Cladophialophora chaetospira]
MAFSGDLLWVNHDAKNRKARPHRHQVFSHIQSGYHKWRRIEAARSMRKSVIIPRPLKARSPRAENAKDAQDPDRMHIKSEEAQSASVQSIVPFRGNSDPFTSAPVQVNSRVNDIMAFERRCVFPVIQGPGPRLQAQDKGNILPSWSSFASDSLGDNLTALNFLRTPLTLMAQSAPGSSYPRLALIYRQKGLKALQAYVRDHGQPPLQILMHFLVAEIWAGNYDDALPHLRLARTIMESQLRENPKDIVPYKWISVYQMDIHRAALSLSPTMFPTDGWVMPLSKFLYPSWMSAQTPQLDALYDLFINDPAPRRAVWIHLRMRTLVLIGRAINHGVSGHDIAASLALAYILKLVTGLENIPVGLTSIYNAGPKMLGRARLSLDLVVLNPRLRLWILYVGALSGDEWFTRSFDEQTILMGVNTWEVCKGILSRFYLPKDEPQVQFHAIYDARLSKKIVELMSAFQEVKLDAG